jgi:cell fate (sporulation/competence/biofilm development) regulator YmcA (YheA/YmcA/DUF963 family)
MANMTLSIPDELHKKMKQMRYVKWSEVARKAFEERVNELNYLDKLLANSKMTEKDALALGKIINRAAYKKLQHEFDNRHKRPDSSIDKRRPFKKNNN